MLNGPVLGLARSPACWEEPAAMRATLCSLCSLLGLFSTASRNTCTPALLRWAQLLGQCHTVCGAGLTRTCQSLCGPLFYSLSHPPETVLSSGFISVTLGVEAVYFAPLPGSSIYCLQILLFARRTRSWFLDSQ